MYDEKIENLINIALADGELTEKERQILFKRAEAAGIDLDEFEMVLDNRLAEVQKKVTPSVQPATTGVTSNEQRIADLEGNSSIKKLMILLEEAEASLRSKSKGTGFWGNLLSDIDYEIAERKSGIIKTFPIPNTRETIIEFISLSAPNAGKKKGFFSDATNEEKILSNAWRDKLEQVFIKACIMLKDDPEVMGLVDHYSKELDIKIKR